MLLSVQFPLADARTFTTEGSLLLGRPSWPSADPDIDFVRSFGSVRKRKLGGVDGWIGESAVCEAGRAMRFTQLAPFRPTPDASPLIPSIAYRRFFSDGLAVGKFEVGVSIESRQPPAHTDESYRKLITHILSFPTTIPALPRKALAESQSVDAVSTTFGSAGKPLARLYCGSSLRHPPPVMLQEWWVVAGTPLLFAVHPTEEEIPPSFRSKPVSIVGAGSARLYYQDLSHQGRTLRMWLMQIPEGASYAETRKLKIGLMRLHAEHHALRTVLKHVGTGKIAVVPNSAQSDVLQRYLNEATRRISRLNTETNRLTEPAVDVAEIARSSEDAANPGERTATLELLKTIKIRKNIADKVEKYVTTEIHIQGDYMEGSKYDIKAGNIGAVGDNASAANSQFNNWNESGGDLKTLAEELKALRQELGQKATKSEEFEATAAIAKAEEAARNGDGPGVFEQLKKAGNWALEAAMKIGTTVGVPVAIAALKKALGV